MSCTFAAIVEVFSIDLNFELGFSFRMVGASSIGDWDSSFGYGSAIVDGVVDVGIDAISLGKVWILMIFIFISIVLTSVIFFVYGLSLPNRGVIDLSFEGNMSCYFSEEGVGCSDWFHSLTVIYTIKRLNHHFYYANSKNYIPTLLVKLFNFFWCSPLHYKKNTKLHINKNK